jgi:glyoxylase-like metal-dependent hydrolase (beta-lactamase superfamily II)
MSEPKRTAKHVEEVVPGLWQWSVRDDRIGDVESDAHALADEGGTVLIDPLPLEPKALRRLERVAAICLTAACHQRSAWRYRKVFGVKVYAPEGSRPMDEEPDVYYRADEMLPGGLKAIRTPGPERAHFAFWRQQAPGILFCADLIMRVESGELEFIPPEYHDDPQATRDSVRRLLDLPFTVLCLDHGAPVKEDPHAALRRLLEAE